MLIRVSQLKALLLSSPMAVMVPVVLALELLMM